jgi:hypothetical protein
MWPYLAVPTYLIELLWNFLPCLGQLKGETFVRVSPTLPLFEINRREYDTMVPKH